MQISDKAKFKELLENVMSYYRQDTSTFVLDLWWNACKGFEFEQFSKAMTRHATDPDIGQFAPKVADIVRVLSGTRTDRAALAWGKVYEAMQRVGQYQDLVFDDPAIHATIMDLGGWVKICQTKEEEISYLQHRFCESHRAYTGRGEFDFPRSLIGLRSPDHEYKQRGLPIPEPILIGDPEKAVKVFNHGKQGCKIETTLGNKLLSLQGQ
jgi:hypothetical protein